MLTTLPSHYATSKEKLFIPQNLDSDVQWNLSVLASWTAKDDRSLELIWSTGFAGYDVRLVKSGAEFRGTAHYFTDTDPNPPNWWTKPGDLAVAVRKTKCQGK